MRKFDYFEFVIFNMYDKVYANLNFLTKLGKRFIETSLTFLGTFSAKHALKNYLYFHLQGHYY